MKKKNWEVRMECVVTKIVYLENCTEEDARSNPWDFATNEQETEQVDWTILSVHEAD